MTGPEPDLTVVVMAFNEIGTVEAVLTELAAELDALGRPHELLIVDDGSTDGTEAVVARFAIARPGCRVVRHAVNRGLGGVYRTGFADARGRFLTFFPADGQFPASIIREFRQTAEEADLVLGYLRERRRSVLGRFLSQAERVVYRAVLGRVPRFQGIFMVRRTLLATLPLMSRGRGWAVVMEMILRASRTDARIVSRPTPHRPRSAGVSKVNNLRTIAANLVQVLALRTALHRDAPAGQE